MSERKLFILGTSAQVPTRYRNHNAYLLRWDEECFLFDPGEGTQRQMIFANIAHSCITKIFITHFHGDHCLGLAGVIQRISLDQVSHWIDIYFPASGKIYYEHLKKASIYHNLAKIQEHPIEKEGIIFQNNKLTVMAKHLDHVVETFGYRIQEQDSYTLLPHKLKALGLQGPIISQLKQKGKIVTEERTIHIEEVGILKRGQSVAFIMDTRLCDAALELAQGVDLLICEATYLAHESKEAEKYAHLTASQAATLAKKAQAKTLILTHFSQRYFSLTPFIEEAKAIHPNVIVVKDGDWIEIPREKRSIG